MMCAVSVYISLSSLSLSLLFIYLFLVVGLLCGRLAPLPSVQVQSQNRCIVMTALGTY